MINAQPSAPGCVLATCIRVECEEEDLSFIRAELGLSADATVTPEHMTEHTLRILNAHYTSRGQTAVPLPPLPF